MPRGHMLRGESHPYAPRGADRGKIWAIDATSKARGAFGRPGGFGSNTFSTLNHFGYPVIRDCGPTPVWQCVFLLLGRGTPSGAVRL